MTKKRTANGGLKSLSAIPQPKQKEKAQSKAYFTRHRTGGPEFTDPIHGETAWKSGIEYRYEGITEPHGFVTVAQFQRNKSVRTKRPDHHITSLEEYEAMATEELLPPFPSRFG